MGFRFHVTSKHKGSLKEISLSKCGDNIESTVDKNLRKGMTVNSSSGRRHKEGRGIKYNYTI